MHRYAVCPKDTPQIICVDAIECFLEINELDIQSSLSFMALCSFDLVLKSACFFRNTSLPTKERRFTMILQNSFLGKDNSVIPRQLLQSDSVLFLVTWYPFTIQYFSKGWKKYLCREVWMILKELGIKLILSRFFAILEIYNGFHDLFFSR